MTEVTITFKVPDYNYDEYEDILEDFLSSLALIGIEENVDVTEL